MTKYQGQASFIRDINGADPLKAIADYLRGPYSELE
jgi:hypothetical protein